MLTYQVSKVLEFAYQNPQGGLVIGLNKPNANNWSRFRKLLT